MNDLHLTFGWFNFRTEEMDYLTETPEDFHDYISQQRAAQHLYDLYILAGDLPIEAARKVLSLCAGIPY